MRIRNVIYMVLYVVIWFVEGDEDDLCLMKIKMEILLWSVVLFYNKWIFRS